MNTNAIRMQKEDAVSTCRNRVNRDGGMQEYDARPGGKTTIPAIVREKAAIRTDTPLTWVEIEPQLWRVGPEARHPEDVAAAVAAALVEPSPFPKLMRRLIAGEIPRAEEGRTRRGYAPVAAPALSEDADDCTWRSGTVRAPPPSRSRFNRWRCLTIRAVLRTAAGRLGAGGHRRCASWCALEAGRAIGTGLPAACTPG